MELITIIIIIIIKNVKIIVT